MNILFASSEASPFAKVGGLGDVVGSLPAALREIGHDARLIMPKYGVIPEKFSEDFEFVTNFTVLIGQAYKYVGLFRYVHRGVTVYFLDNKEFFGGDVYGYDGNNEAERTVFFCRAVIESIAHLGFEPEVLHLNDWQTALIPALLKWQYPQLTLKTVLTIHNLRYQGLFDIPHLQGLTGLPDEAFTIDCLEFYGCANILKSGIVLADKVNTVSPHYAEETLTGEYGERLEGVLAMRGENYSGILNGIDYEVFHPRKDARIAAPYGPRSLGGKAVCKKALAEELELDEDKCFITVISRLVDQKGLDILAECAESLLTDPRCVLIVLGTGEPQYEALFDSLAQRYPENARAILKYDGALAQRLYAGSDLLLVPSRFEPCGLTQIIAMKYGTLPLVRETGGLYDTVRPYNETDGSGCGFTFAPYAAHDLAYTIRRAVSIYFDEPDVWKKLIGRAMRMDYSWKQSAQLYAELYRSALQ
ncbi:MAG: glycogen synthase [Clostridia bacterium]|nr:glycogen synthase [Clostridia bacterium]